MLAEKKLEGVASVEDVERQPDSRLYSRWLGSRGSGRYLGIFDAPNLDLAYTLFRLSQVIRCLHPQSRLRAATERLLQRIAISAEIPALPLTRLFIACRMTPSALAPFAIHSPSGSRQLTDSPRCGGFFMRMRTLAVIGSSQNLAFGFTGRRIRLSEWI